MSAAEEQRFVAFPRIVGIVAEACCDDPDGRTIAEKDDAAAFSDQDEQTQRFWRCIARAALNASGHAELIAAVEGLIDDIDDTPEANQGRAALAKARGEQ